MRSIYMGWGDGLGVMVGGNGRYGRGGLEGFLYWWEEMVLVVGLDVWVEWMEKC